MTEPNKHMNDIEVVAREITGSVLPCPYGHIIKDFEDFIYPAIRDKSIYKACCDHPDCSWSILGSSEENVLRLWNDRQDLSIDALKKQGYVKLDELIERAKNARELSWMDSARHHWKKIIKWLNGIKKEQQK